MINLIDTHFHLDYYKNHNKLYEEINNLRQYTLCVTNLPEVFESCIDLYKQTKYLKFALGYNPQMIKDTPFNKSSFLRCLNKTKYIGEVGLDFSNQYLKYKGEQLEIFDYICNIAARQSKILSIHSRKAEKEVLEILKKNNVKSAILHWYTGESELIEEFINIGCYFSINPAMLNRKNGLNIINRIPLNRILIESDGPLGKLDGRKIMPNDIEEIYLRLKEKLLDKRLEETIFNNFKQLLQDNDKFKTGEKYE